jgi:hypothetical protein
LAGAAGALLAAVAPSLGDVGVDAGAPAAMRVY